MRNFTILTYLLIRQMPGLKPNIKQLSGTIVMVLAFNMGVISQTSEGPNDGATFTNEAFFGSTASWVNLDSAETSDDSRHKVLPLISSNCKASCTDLGTLTPYL